MTRPVRTGTGPWSPLLGVAAILGSEPRFPASVVSGLALRGFLLADVASAAVLDLSCRDGTDHGDDDLNLLAERIAGHAALESEEAGRPAIDARCLADLRAATASGATLRDLAEALAGSVRV